MASRYGAGAGPDKRVVLIVARRAETRAALAQSLRSAGYAIELAEGFARAQNVIATTRIDFGSVAATAVDDSGPGTRVLERCAGGVTVAAARADALERLTNTGSFAIRSLDPSEIAARVQEVLWSESTDKDSALDTPEASTFERFALDISGQNLADTAGKEAEHAMRAAPHMTAIPAPPAAASFHCWLVV